MADGADHAIPGPSDGFPATLRALRRAAGLTQEELANRAGVGVRTVRELERGRVLRPQRGTLGLLAEALGLHGSTLEAFLAGRLPWPFPDADLPDRAGASAAQPARPDLVGRDTELKQLAAALSSAHVVTLTGLAGVGKSCLAVAALHDCTAGFPGGVNGMAISDGSRRDDVLATVASVFGVARTVDLAERFARDAALIMFDSADRSPRAAAEAIRWLRSRVPNLKILVTSRHALGVPGEVHRRVEPLDVPPPPPAEQHERHEGSAAAPSVDHDLAALRSYPAVALFLGRLHEVRPEPPQDRDAPVIAELVRRLGGLPLALELAAARGRVLDLPELLQRYGDRVLDLGAVAAEGTTLRDALAASYRLLDPDDQWALRRLSAFRGRWSLDLAEELLADTAPAAGSPGPVQSPGAAQSPGPEHRDVEAVLDRLVGLGLVNVRPYIELRFRLLDMVRDFAAEECAAHGETALARGCHARVMARLSVRAAPELAGARMPEAVAGLDRLAPDIRAALAFAAVHDPHTALRTGAAIVRWCRFRGRDRETRAVLRRLLDDPRTAGAGAVLRAWAAVGAAMLAVEHGDGLVELAGTQDALKTFVAARNVAGELTARLTLCRVLQTIGAYEEVGRHGAAALVLATRTGRVRDQAVAHQKLAWQDIRVGDLPAANRRLHRAGELAIAAGDARLIAVVDAALAEVARLGGACDDSVDQGRAALEVLATHGDPGHRIRTLGSIGRALAESGRLTEAEAVLAELAGYGTAGAGVRIMVDASIALARGDTDRAAAQFAAAADVLVGRHDIRDVVEALVGAAAATSDPDQRAGLIAALQAVAQRCQLSLLPRDLAALQ